MLNNNNEKVEKPMERRWSIVGTSFIGRKRLHGSKSSISSELKKISSTTSLSSLDLDKDFNNFNVEEHTNDLDLDLASVKNSHIDSEVPEEYIRISKSEYEEIKERVFKIEYHLSQEINNISSQMKAVDQSKSIGNNDVTDTVETVEEEYKKTLNETEILTEFSSAANDLANRLNKELKIRNSSGKKIIRSPSARKIGTIRRKSQEIKRRASYDHISSRLNEFDNKFVEKPIPEALFYPKINLKRGRPNTIQSGLKHPTYEMSEPGNISEWKNAEDFFKEQDETVFEAFETPKTYIRSSPRLAAKSSNNKSSNSQTKTPHFVSKLIIGDITDLSNVKMNSPMKRDVEKIPPNSIKNKNIMTPLRDAQTGRASIARIRNQNAGMVMAKAKLFDGMALNDNIHELIMNDKNPKTTTPKRRATIRKQQLKMPTPKQKSNIRSPKTSSKSSNKNYEKAFNIKENENQMIGSRSPKIKTSLTPNPKIVFKTPSNDMKNLRKPMRATPISFKNSARQ